MVGFMTESVVAAGTAAPRRGTYVLRERYGLFQGPLAETSQDRSQVWLGVQSADQEPCLIKTWRFADGRPDQFQRALWDSQLRNLYRLGSSPGSEKSILVLRDAGVDSESRCFVMVLHSSARGYTSLETPLATRADNAWLSAGEPLGRRRELWRGLQQVLQGVRLLHDQNMLHRNLGAAAVFCDTDIGPQSFRLGGFEWSLRLGVPATDSPRPSWSTPPEDIESDTRVYSQEADWFGFGVLAARCLLNLENYRDNPPVDRYTRTIRSITRANPRDLSELERELLLRLLASDKSERLDRVFEINAAIVDIIDRLSRGLASDSDQPLVLVVNPAADSPLALHAAETGFVPDPANPDRSYNPNDPVHVGRLMMFVQGRLETAQIHPLNDRAYLVVGEGLDPLIVTQYRSLDMASGTETETWDQAFCVGVGELRYSLGSSQCIELRKGKVAIRSVQEANRNRKTITQTAESWSRYLPTSDTSSQLRENLATFHGFISCANQIELLIRDSELFGYEVVSVESDDSGADCIRLKERPRERPPLDIFKTEGGLVEFIHKEVENNKPQCRLVALSDEYEDTLDLPRHVSEAECWNVAEIDTSAGMLTLKRAAGELLPQPPPVGIIRTYGMFGQVALIRRRKRAIDRLQEHSYLLRSLVAPGQVYMDTGEEAGSLDLSPDRVDPPKQAAIHDILRVRPIYALQGPPGTGKTTLVAHLLRQVLDEDPVAQVLITAQAHGAVDVLREKVRDEAFRGIPSERQPLAIRLGRQNELGEVTEGSVEDVAMKMLDTARQRLDSKKHLSPVAGRWRAAVDALIDGIRTGAVDREAPEFLEIVKRGANLIYCTTSSGDLEDLADLALSFDWAIVEEAGKAHCFDLALPLQAGHRWLLIGDHRQLPPYRFEEYTGGFAELERVVEALWELPDANGRLKDTDWLRRWEARTPEDRAAFKEYASRWLNTFERIYDHCSTAPGYEERTVETSVGAAAGMLSRQHRMHPTIGSLISGAYYDGQLVNETSADDTWPRGRAHSIGNPPELSGVALAWLDVPDAAVDLRCAERGGPGDNKPRYSNPTEVRAVRALLQSLQLTGPVDEPLEIAVLSPYNQQVALLNRELDDLELGEGFVRKQGLHRRAANKIRTAHTVDSFQGNQADVIIVSLVRNNTQPPGHGLGFLDEAQRFNVLLSRAERLLILVGSWTFFERQLSAVSSENRYNKLWHLRKVLDSVTEFTAEGAAARIPFPGGTPTC